MPIGALPTGSAKTMRFTGATLLEGENGLITEMFSGDDGVTASISCSFGRPRRADTKIDAAARHFPRINDRG
jgi:hypothetical protein